MIKHSAKSLKSPAITVPTYNDPDLKLVKKQKNRRKATSASTPKAVKAQTRKRNNFESILKDVGNHRLKPNNKDFLTNATGHNQTTTRSKVFSVSQIQQ